MPDAIATLFGTGPQKATRGREPGARALILRNRGRSETAAPSQNARVMFLSGPEKDGEAMPIRAIRVAPLAITVLLIVVTLMSWTHGAPPTWSQFGPRTTAIVVETSSEPVRIADSRLRYYPRVTVKVQGTNDPRNLEGLIAPEREMTEPMARAFLESYPVGGTVTIRLIDGVAFADRLDWFNLAHAIILTVLTGCSLAIALVFLRWFAD